MLANTLIMHRHHFYIGIILFVFGGMGSYYISHNGYYPVAIVNSQPILASDLTSITDSAFGFYLKALDTYKKDALSDADAAKLLREIKRATLEKLIEEHILSGEIAARFGDKLPELLDSKLKSVNNGNLERAVPTLYGLSVTAFRKTVLEPEATRELLSESFKTKNEDFTAWLKKQKSAASVYVFLPGLAWTGEALEAR